MTTYYVTTSGSDSNNGLTEGTAFATPGYAAGQATVSGDIIYIKSGTYTLSTTTANTSGGPLSLYNGVRIEGYQTTVGDQAAKPVINAGTQTGIPVIRSAGNNWNALAITTTCIEVDGNSQSVTGFSNNYQFGMTSINCIARNCSVEGFKGLNGERSYFLNCSAFDCATGFNSGYARQCLADSCTNGFVGGFGAVIQSVASNNTSNGFNLTSFHPLHCHKCVAYANGANGFDVNIDNASFCECIASENGGYGFDTPSAASDPLICDSADYNNTLGRKNQTGTKNREIRPITLTSDPFVDAANLDFRINDVAGGGSELRQIQLSGLVGINGVFDIGAIDAVVTAGGGGAVLHPLRSN